MFKKKFVLILLLSFAFNVHAFSRSSLVEKDGKWTLLVDNKPYYINGVTFAIDYNEKNIDSYMQELKELGCNTIRTWGVGDGTQLLLDKADQYGIKVVLGSMAKTWKAWYGGRRFF